VAVLKERVRAPREVIGEETGTVWKLVTAVGQRVDEDEPIVIVESMKMEIPVPAPYDGIVKELRVAEGDVVEEGQVVAILEA